METRQCQNCKLHFTVEAEDFLFYEKIHVPVPTFCPQCRMIRRMLFRNERALYKTTCGLCGKGMVSIYAPFVPYQVYCLPCYQSEKWDSMSYSREYDFSKSFFEQFGELMRRVPRRSLYQDFASKSDYTNWAVYLENCYLVFGGHHYEDVMYSSSCFYTTQCSDIDFCKKCEQCYDSIHLRECNRVHFSMYSESCTDSAFLNDCRNCHNCIGCTNLRNASYCIFNIQYTKDDYEVKARELELHTYSGLEKVRREAFQHFLKYPQKFAWMKNVHNSTGDDLEQVKNCHYCFTASEDEDCLYSFFVPTGAKDCYDLDHVGLGSENACEVVSGFGLNRVAYSTRVYFSHDVFYSDDCFNSAYLFGCIGLRKKEYCIFNTQYTKEEYEALVPKIIDQMNRIPYMSRAGHSYRFGEFFPPDISPFAYNETTAQEYFSLTQNEAHAKGYAWKNMEKQTHQITLYASDLQESIGTVTHDVVTQTIGCAHRDSGCNEQCTGAFRIIIQELEFYKKFNLPLPHLCPNCRHYQRLKRKRPLSLWHRSCGCGQTENLKLKTENTYKNTAEHFHEEGVCSNSFWTAYAPERSEIVYCEECYQAEVA